MSNACIALPDTALSPLPRMTEPKFLEQRVDHYFIERLAKECGGIHPMKGAVPKRNSIILRSNDYLSLSNHPKIQEAMVVALLRYGLGTSISRSFVYHYQDLLSNFERRLASLMQGEAALLCNSGYGANVAVIQAIAGPDAPVYMDMRAHISLWEGAKSANAPIVPIRHNDVQHLARMIEVKGPGVIVVDAIYSIDGNICPLQDLVDVAEATGSVLVVDETHSFGTRGADGAGLVVEQGLASRVHFRTVGLSKAVASRGGAIICSERHAEYLRYSSVQAIFSTGVLPHEVAGYNAALDLFASEPWRQQRVHANHTRLWHGLDALGYNVDASRALIIALDAGDIQQTTRLRDALEAQGVFGAIFMPPATPSKRCVMRFSINASLTDGQIDYVIGVCADVAHTLAVDNWPSTKRKARGGSVTRTAA